MNLRAYRRGWIGGELITTRMVIYMDETRLRTIEHLEESLSATPEVVFAAPGAGRAAENQRYEHISRVLTRFDYPRRNKHERGVVLAYLRRTSGYGRAQVLSPGCALGRKPCGAASAAQAIPSPGRAVRSLASTRLPIWRLHARS